MVVVVVAVPGADDVVTVMPFGAEVVTDPGAPGLAIAVGDAVAPPFIGVEVWADTAAGKRVKADAHSAALANRAIMLMAPSLPTGVGNPTLALSYCG